MTHFALPARAVDRNTLSSGSRLAISRRARFTAVIRGIIGKPRLPSQERFPVHGRNSLEDLQVLGNHIIAHDELELAFDEPEANHPPIGARLTASLEAAHEDIRIDNNRSPVFAGTHDFFLRWRYSWMISSVWLSGNVAFRA